MKRLENQQVHATIKPVEGKYLQTRYHLDRQPVEITVGMGEHWTPLACKEVFGKAVKVLLELDMESCAFDLTAPAKLGEEGICAAVEGIYGGSYKQKNAMTNVSEPGFQCYAIGEGWTDQVLEKATVLAQHVMLARNMVNCPSNMLTPAIYSTTICKMAEGLPIKVQTYSREELEAKGLGAFLSVGNSSDNIPSFTVLRYHGNPESKTRLGYVGKGITMDTGGYCLKNRESMKGMKADMAGGAAVAAAVCALAANRVKTNVVAVLPACENRLSNSASVPGNVITSFAGKTIEVLNTDAEGRLLLCDGMTWAIREEKVTHLVDVATLTGAVQAMLGGVATGIMANDDAFYGQLEAASARSGERIWRMPSFPEYERLIDSDLADLRNTTKNGCGAIAAGMFLQHFTEDKPWLHVDIAGTADGAAPVWQHQVGGATGVAVSTLYFLAEHIK